MSTKSSYLIVLFLIFAIVFVSRYARNSTDSRLRTVVLLDTTNKEISKQEIMRILQSTLTTSNWHQIDSGFVTSDNVVLKVVEKGNSVAVMMLIPSTESSFSEESLESVKLVETALERLEPFSSSWKSLGKPTKWLKNSTNEISH